MKRLKKPEPLEGSSPTPSPLLAAQGWNSTTLRKLPQAAELSAPTKLDLWLALLIANGVLGFVAILVGFLKGHESVFGVERGVPWGILIPTYVFFAVSSAGICFVSSLGHVFGIRRFHLLGKRAIFLAIVTLVAGLIAIGSELERPWRVLIFAVLTPNPASAIWWMATFYTFELLFLVTEFIALSRVDLLKRSRELTGLPSRFYHALALFSRDASEKAARRDARVAYWAGIGGILSAGAGTSTLGAVFGLISAKPFWYGPFMPIYLIFSAFVSGTALLVLVTLVNYRAVRKVVDSEEKDLMLTLGKLLAFFLGVFLVFLAWNTIVGIYGGVPGKSDALMLLVKGPLSLPFWGLEIVLGIVIPFLLLFNRRTRTVTGITVASLLVAVGLFAARYDLVIAGQLVPVSGGTANLYYFPSYTEWLIVMGIFCFWAFLYTLGERVLPLNESQQGSHHS